MTGPASEPPPSVPGNNPLPPDSAPWVDTEEMSVDFPPAGSQITRTVTPAAGKGQDMATIGHIGRYALKYQIGEGGLGRVYAAHDPLLSRLIAIKTLNLEISAEERDSFNTLFLNEARAAGGLSHPHIVTVFDAGVSEQGPYIAMELLRGRDLRQLRLEGWRPTPTQAALYRETQERSERDDTKEEHSKTRRFIRESITPEIREEVRAHAEARPGPLQEEVQRKFAERGSSVVGETAATMGALKQAIDLATESITSLGNRARSMSRTRYPLRASSIAVGAFACAMLIALCSPVWQPMQLVDSTFHECGWWQATQLSMTCVPSPR